MLPRSTEKVSVLGFGCAAVLGRVGRRDSLRALSAASDAGINFYDTARAYGYGGSEGLLGEFLAGRRDQVVLCTKFGILPAGRDWRQFVKPLARNVVRLFPGLRKAAQRQASTQFASNQFSVEVLRSSLETSLRELRTDYVDMLLMHAAPPSVLGQQDLLEEMERLVEAGKVRLAGISGPTETIAATFAQRPAVLQTAQFACNIENMALTRDTALQAARAGSRLFLVANHPFGGAQGVADCAAKIEQMRSSAAFPQELREKLVPGDPMLMPEVVLNCILSGTGIDAVIPAMMQVHHLESNCRAVENCRFTPGELAIIRDVFAGERTLQAEAGVAAGADR